MFSPKQKKLSKYWKSFTVAKSYSFLFQPVFLEKQISFDIYLKPQPMFSLLNLENCVFGTIFESSSIKKKFWGSEGAEGGV